MTKGNVVKFLTLFSLFSQKINSIISRFYKKFSLNYCFFAFVLFFLSSRFYAPASLALIYNKKLSSFYQNACCITYK